MALVEMAMSGNGYVTASQATEAGIPRRKLTEAVGRGDLVQVARGLYALPETWEDPYLVAHQATELSLVDGLSTKSHLLNSRQ